MGGREGSTVGLREGSAVGKEVGQLLGVAVGEAVGVDVGDAVPGGGVGALQMHPEASCATLLLQPA